ncbi:hypothetical protein ABGN05_25140 [Aquibium sp. LZ166]|uniref:Secreted protein n=1 Tax=Aquibium pacificus TaxID=3153579 RepID=A0ABV3SQ52_9HYPH
MVRIASHAFRQIARTALVGGVLLLASVPGAFAQSGGHGSNTDSVTGWRCINPFCDTIVQPKTRCLCQKNNPNETVASKLSLTCVPPRAGQTCPAPRFGR